MWHVWQRREMKRGFQLESMKEMDHLADLSRCEDNTKSELWETVQDGVE